MASDPVTVASILPIDRRRGRGWRRWIIITESFFRLLTDDYRLEVKPGTGNGRDPKYRSYLAVFACAFLGSLSLLLPTPCYALSDSFARRYSLSGALELSYDRSSSQGKLTDDFRQFFSLDHRGYVADPKLLSYEISGRVSHDGGNGSESTTLMGGNLGLTLFRSLPNGLQRYTDYVPHPIWLRYSRESGNAEDSTSYGLTFMHSVTRKQFVLAEDTPTKSEGVAPKPEGEGVDADLYEDGPSRNRLKIVEKERLPFPTTFFDYDHYDQKSQGINTVNDILSLRSSLTGDYYDYRFLYENQNQTGSRELQRSVLQLEPIYRFYNEETKRRVDIRNLLRYEEYNKAQNIEMGSNINWSKPLGKDELSVSAAVGYSGSSSAELSAKDYNASAAGNYRKFISSRVTSSTSLSTAIKKRESVDMSTGIFKSASVNDHTVRLSDTVSADISRFYNGKASAYVGNGAQGTEYGASAALFTKTRITTSLSYSYSLSAPQISANTDLTQSPLYTPTNISSGRTSKHDVALSAAGPLLNNLAFQARAGFVLSEAPVNGGVSTEETGSLTGNLLWRMPKTAVTLGGNYIQSKRTDTEISESTSTSLFGTLTRVLPMRMLFNLYSNWTKTASTGVSNSESTRLEIRPKLRWTSGLTSVDTEYSYTRSTESGGSSVDQRFFVRLVRRFSAVL